MSSSLDCLSTVVVKFEHWVLDARSLVPNSIGYQAVLSVKSRMSIVELGCQAVLAISRHWMLNLWYLRYKAILDVKRSSSVSYGF